MVPKSYFVFVVCSKKGYFVQKELDQPRVRQITTKCSKKASSTKRGRRSSRGANPGFAGLFAAFCGNLFHSWLVELFLIDVVKTFMFLRANAPARRFVKQDTCYSAFYLVLIFFQKQQHVLPNNAPQETGRVHSQSIYFD